MGAKAKKALKKNMKRASSSKPSQGADFLPLEGGPARKLPEQKPLENTATVLYVGRIPHGFYEKEMEGYFGQFGTIKRLRISRNKRTGKSRHFGFIEFESPEALATRDVVALSGGLNYHVPTGRRDGLVSISKESDENLLSGDIPVAAS
uniref:RNA-binding protein C1827.05c family n=1 Tax=Cajanus cajan TaxID=3821 RepID=A0A151QME4_CAJCA|nr:putative RNA-binding protein C1827.05c family [Cajanus cajan]